jgi:trigger factor
MMYPGREKEIYKLYSSPEAVNAVVGPILENKVVELLIQKVKIEEKNCTAEELKAIDEEPFDFFKDDNAEGEKSEPKKKPAAKKKKTEE